jgi:hypothetical protein
VPPRSRRAPTVRTRLALSVRGRRSSLGRSIERVRDGERGGLALAAVYGEQGSQTPSRRGRRDRAGGPDSRRLAGGGRRAVEGEEAGGGFAGKKAGPPLVGRQVLLQRSAPLLASPRTQPPPAPGGGTLRRRSFSDRKDVPLDARRNLSSKQGGADGAGVSPTTVLRGGHSFGRSKVLPQRK